jgi:HD-GYP domain-containing protein (c-di-GMP phosphodiesterase class II)
MAVADSLDAMTTDRPYRAALTFEEAKSEIRRNSARQYDPVVVKAFFDAIDDPAFKRLAERPLTPLAAD